MNNKNLLYKLILKSFFISLLLFVVLTVSTNKSYAANVTWDGGGSDGTCGGGAGDGNKWSCGTNWSTDSIPASGDTAIFDSTSTKSATIDANISITAININTGYSGTITQASGVTITLSSTSTTSAFSQAAGTFMGGNSAITLSSGGFTLSGGAFTSTSGVFSVSKNFTVSDGTFAHGSGTFTFSNSSHASVLSCNSIVFNSVIFSKSASTQITVGSNCTIPISGTNPTSTANIINNGRIDITGTWSITGSYTSNSGAVLTMTGTSLSTSDNLVLNGGTFPAGVTTLNVSDTFNNVGNVLEDNLDLVMQGTSFINLTCGDAIFNSITVTKSTGSTVTPTSDCTTETFTLNSGSVINPASAYSFNVTGDFTVNVDGLDQNFGGANLTLIFNGSNDQNITQKMGGIKSPFVVTKATGKAIMQTNGFIINSQTCTVSQGTLYLNGYNFICSAGFTVETGTTLEVNGNEYFTEPTFEANSDIIYKGTSNSATDYAALPSLSYKNVTINSTDASDVFDTRDLLETNLVGYWKMEAGSGSVEDVSSNNNTASLNGNAAYTTTVPTLSGETSSYAMDFDGSGDYLNPGSNLNLIQNTKGVTISAWIRKDTNSGIDQIFGLSVNNHAGNSRVFLETNGSELECAARAADSEAGYTVNTAAILSTATWYHATCVIDYPRDNITIFLNGVPQQTEGTVAFTATSTDDTTSLNSSIGIDEDKAGGDFDGQIDEVRVYSRALSAEEIIAMGAGRTVSTETDNITIANDFTLSSGSFYPTSTLTVTGSWTNNGTFNHNSGTVILNGSAQSISGDTTFYNLTKQTASTDTLSFQANKTQIIANTLTLNGADLNLLSLRSLSNGTHWSIDPQGTRTISYLDVKDSNNINASEITVNGLNITDSGNNINWAFAGAEPAISLTALSPDPNSDNTPSISGTATEETGTVANIEYQMDGTGGSWNACTADDGTFDEAEEAFTCTIGSTLSDASHTIYVRATDNEDNVTPNESAATDSFTIDTTPPAITLTEYSPDPTTDTTPTFTGSITDTSSNTSSVEYQMDGTSGSWSACTADDGAFNETSENFSCTISPSLSEAEHTVYIRATDALNNTTTNLNAETDTISIDITAPTVPGTPSATTGATDSTPTWQWAESTDTNAGLSATDAYTLEWSQDENFLSGVSTTQVGTNNCSLGTCTYTNTSGLTDGTWYFRAKAEDTLGNTSAYSSNGSLFIDSTSPTISLTAISPDPTTDTTPTLIGTATDVSSTISSVQYQMDSLVGTWLSCTADDGTFDEASEDFTCNISPALSGGSHTIYTRATDSVGNVSSNPTGHRDSFSVDISAPSISLTPLSPDPISDSTPAISGSATEETATISNIQYQLDGTGSTWRNCTATDGAFDEASEDFSCTTISTADGSHTIYVRATDSTGNTTTNESASTDSFTIDTTYPAISLTAITPDPGNDTTPTITGTATDTHGTVANVNYQVDATDGSWTACTADDATFDEASEAFSCTVSPALDDGSHTIYLQAIDALSNTTTTINLSSDAFVIDTTSATITLDTISQNATSDTTPAITGNVVDSLLTIVNAQFQMDGTGGTWNNCTADDGAFNSDDEDFTCSVSSTLNEGAHTIYVRVTDSEGKTTANGAAKTLNFNVDTTSPSVSLTPISPDPTSDTTPTITGTATDAFVLTVAVQFQIDATDAAWTACTADDGTFDETSEAFSCTAGSTLADGAHTIYIRTIDSLNNTTSSGYTNDTFTVSTEAPAITLGTISPDPIGDSTPSITGNAVSTYSTVANIQYQIDVTSGSWNNCTADDGTFNSNDEDFTCTVGSALAQGAHTIYVRAVDALGTTTANDDLESDLFTVDTGGPTLTISALSPDPNTDNTPTFSGTASDVFSTIASVSYQVDSTAGSWSACTPNDSLFNSSPEAYNCTTSTLSDGTHTIYVRATDSLGNITASGSYKEDTFVVDVSAPSVPGTPSTITSSDDATPTWNWAQSTDTGSGLSSSNAYTLEWSQSSSFSSGVNTTTVGTSSCSAGTCSFTHSTRLDNATWYFRIKTTDIIGHESDYSDAGSITISASADTEAPTGSINLDEYTNTRDVTIVISATDDLSSPENLLMMISESASFSGASWVAYSTSKTFTLSENSATKTVYIKFKDELENQSETYSDSIIYDKDNPSKPKLDTPTDNSTSTEDKLTFRFKKAEDDHSGINKYILMIDDEVYIDDINPEDPGSSENHTREVADAKITYDDNYIEIKIKIGLSDKKHTWEVKAVDRAGNTRKSDARKFTVDSQKPNLELTGIDSTNKSVKPTSENGISFTTTKDFPTFFGLTETGSTIEIDLNNEDIKCTLLTSQPEWKCKIEEPLETGRRYEIKIKATDNAGNQTMLPTVYLIKAEYNFETTITKVAETEDETEKAETPTSTEGYKLIIEVLDNQNNPIPNAKVTVFSTPREGYTNEKGVAVFDQMPEGSHKVIIEHDNGTGTQEIELEGEDLTIKYQIMLMKSNDIPLWAWILIIIGAISTLSLIFMGYKTYFKKR